MIKNTLLWLQKNNLKIASQDLNRPWGAFWQIDQLSLDKFLSLFFPNHQEKNNINPKILLVNADKKLSLQLHHRRHEKWHVIKGPVKVVIDKNEYIIDENQEIEIPVNTPHRLCGLNDYGLVAEIWIHTDPNNISDENDIVRIEDDFNRL